MKDVDLKKALMRKRKKERKKKKKVATWRDRKRVEVDAEKHWNAFSVPIVVEKIVATGGEGREWRQKEMSAIG